MTFFKKYECTIGTVLFSVSVSIMLILIGIFSEDLTIATFYPVYIALGLVCSLVFSVDVNLEKWVEEDIEDIKNGRIWTPLGYKKLDGDINKNIQKYANGEIRY